MNLKKSIAIGLAVAAAFASFGCGGGGEKKNTAPPPSVNAKQEKQVQQQPQEQHPPTVKNKAENIVLEIGQIRMPGGRAVLETTITNNNGSGITIKEAIIAFQIKDGNGAPIWSDGSHFENVNLYIPAGEQRLHNFTINNPQCPAYEGQWQAEWKYVFGK